MTSVRVYMMNLKLIAFLFFFMFCRPKSTEKKFEILRAQKKKNAALK